MISKGASEVGNATVYEWTAAAAGGCASSRVGGGSCTDGIAQAWGSMATSYVMMGAATELKAAYASYQYRANLYAFAPVVWGTAILADAGGGTAAGGFWTWVVGGGASAAVGAWAGKNWSKISAALSVNGADNATQPETAPTVPDAPEGKISVPNDKYWKDRGIDPHEVKDNDSTRNLGFDKKGNVWSVDRKGSGNPQWEGTIDSLKQR